MPTGPVERRPWPRRLLNRLEVDRAVFFAIASRAWQFFAGPITMVLIANYFTGEVQGFYYTFWSILALQSFFDFSLNQVLISFSSHEWEKLSLAPDGTIHGELQAQSRLASLLRGSLTWYGITSVAFAVVVGTAGVAFFRQSAPATQLSWLAPWWALVAATATLFLTTPCLAVLEGCNQVQSVYKLLFVKAVVANLVVWMAIPLGAVLWIPAIASGVRLLCECLWIGFVYRRFFGSLYRMQLEHRVDWVAEVWPFQWRVGIKAVLAYFNNSLINPVVFYYHGPVVAGQLGMTWQILSSVQAACLSWVKTRAATFGKLVAKRDFHELDRVFTRVTAIAISICAVLCFVFTGLVMALYGIESRFATRLLPPWPTLLFALGILLIFIPDCQWTYIHAHKRSPYLMLTFLGAGLSAAGIVWLGSVYGALGTSIAYLGVNALFYLPVWSWVWFACRREWHSGH